MGERMSQITLCGDCYPDVTIVSNQFLDEYLKDANDAQIKIYLHLLRCINGNLPVSVSLIADCFNYTEKDVVRALKYWEKHNLISLEFNSSKQLTSIELLPLKKKKQALQPSAANVFTLPAKPSYSLDELTVFKNRPDISQLLFIAEQYLGKTLRPDELKSFLYMHESLGFSADLIEYLIEYCVNNKKKSIRYIESVANSWASSSIHSVEEAKARTMIVSKDVYAVFKALGINTNRAPIDHEISYVHKWTNSYGFDMDIITEACRRTIMTTHTPSFEYTDSILSKWNDAKVRHFSDIAKLDELFQNEKNSVQNITRVKPTGSSIKKSTITPDKFNNFSQRTYNYSELEQEIISN